MVALNIERVFCDSKVCFLPTHEILSVKVTNFDITIADLKTEIHKQFDVPKTLQKQFIWVSSENKSHDRSHVCVLNDTISSLIQTYGKGQLYLNQEKSRFWMKLRPMKKPKS